MSGTCILYIKSTGWLIDCLFWRNHGDMQRKNQDEDSGMDKLIRETAER